MIEDSLGNRKHVMHYDEEVIPSKKDIDEILRTAYPLVTSKQKAYPYKAYILGPNSTRSNRIWNLAEGNKINVDTAAYGDAGDAYVANPGLFHMKSAPWTLIYTPRVAPPNHYYKKAFENTKSLWQLEDANFVNTKNRESMAIEVGMLAKAITGAVLDRGWDTSYNICFIKDMQYWDDFPYLEFRPTLIQTIGKGKKYLYESLRPGDHQYNTDPNFEEIFEYVDGEE